MHTIVIQFQDQSQGKLTFFSSKKKITSESFRDLYTKISQYLSQERISTWQAIVLMGVPTSTHSTARLGKQLQHLQKELFSVFAEQEQQPDSVNIILLDPLKRNAFYAPEDNGSHHFWQIDNFGYIIDSSKMTEKTINQQNMFFEKELEYLDELWGHAFELQKAGVIQNPNKEMITLLEGKKERVLEQLEVLSELKKKKLVQFINETNSENRLNDLLSEELIDEISSSFAKGLEKIITPPLHRDLNTFKPSTLLKEILREKVSIQSSMYDFRVIRLPLSIHSVERRTKALISIALLINAISSRNDVLEKIPKESIYEINLLFSAKQLSTMLSAYKSCLQSAKVKIENKLLQRQTVMKKKFETVKAMPYTAESLEDVLIEMKDFKIRAKRTYFDSWIEYLKKVEDQLDKREERMIQEAKEGAKKLSILKRRDLIKVDEEEDIRDYVTKLKNRVDQLYEELEQHSPPTSKELEEWKQYRDKKEFEMSKAISACPSKWQVGLTLGAAGLFLLGPHFAMTDWSRLELEGRVIEYMAIPSLMVASILGVGYLSKSQIIKPIQQLVQKSKDQQQDLFDHQQVVHRKSNLYMNKLYELYRVRQQYLQIVKEYESEKKENHLYRYHLSKIYDYLDSCENLIQNLSLSKVDQTAHYYEFFEDRFNPKEDVVHNPIYSPFDCVLNHSTEEGSFDVHVGQSKSSLQLGYLRAIERIILSKDQVYRL